MSPAALDLSLGSTTDTDTADIGAKLVHVPDDDGDNGGDDKEDY
jgi:hypothetical protein